MAFTGILYFLGGMALAGVPPLNGFIGKVALARSGINSQNWVTLGLVIGAGILTLLYMMRTWQHIFQRESEQDLHLKPTGDSPLAPTLLIACCIAFGLYAAPLVDLATLAVAQLGDPQIYIRAVLGG